MTRQTTRSLKLLTWLTAIIGLAATPALADTGFVSMSLDLMGVASLGEDYVYEGWLIVDGEPVSTGTFTVDAVGNARPSSFLLDQEIADAATTFVLTIEPAEDTDPLPAHTHYLAGDISSGAADLTIGHTAALGDDFTAAMGGFILETPSTGSTPGDYDQGIWFLDPAGGPGASLDLPTLPDGWMYEGWVVGTDGPQTTGRFLDPAAADDDGGGPDAGPDATPPFPGQDFIMPARVLTMDHAAVISVEPEPEDYPRHFANNPLNLPMIADVGAGVLQYMDNMAAHTPYGSIEFAELVALDLELDGVEPLMLPSTYEGWLIVDGQPVSTGSFVVNADGVPDPARFLVDAEDAADATAFVLTIESLLDMDPAPSDTHFLAGDFMTGEAALTIDHDAALGEDFSMAAGSYILETPSTGSTPGDYNQGIWYLDPAGAPDASLLLPTLPAGWVYEGWVVDSAGPVSTGRFQDPAMADSDGGGPDAGPDATPPFPGQDFITPPRILTMHHAAVISVEPHPDDSPLPFSLKPLVDGYMDDVGAGVLQTMENRSDNVPTGHVTVRQLVPMEISLDGLGSLGEDFVYEGWLVGSGDPVTSGRFRVDALGRAQPTRFLVDQAAAVDAATFVLTIEPAMDPDPAPAHTHVLAGDLEDGAGSITIDHPAALGTGFYALSGSYILETPSTGSTPGDYDQGIWYLDPAGGPGASLMYLPTLPAGWMYEGWVVGTDGPVTTGRFLTASGFDDDAAGPDAGPDASPPFPGQDFIDPARVLTMDHAAVISVEPDPDDSPHPFAIKPLVDSMIEDVGAGVLQTMENMSASNPTGQVDLRLPRPYGVRIGMPAMAHPYEPFWVLGHLDNPDAPRTDVPTFFVLEVLGHYWFWPTWGYYHPPEGTSIDFNLEDVPTGTSTMWVIPLFPWPDTGSDAASGLYFIGAMLNSTMTAIEGEMAIVEWGFGP